MKRSALVVISLLIFAAAAQASVVYSFTGTYISAPGGQLMGPVTFTVTVPAVITATTSNWMDPDASFVPGAQLVCDACSKIDFFVNSAFHHKAGFPSNDIEYSVAGGNIYDFYFAPDSFIEDGTYTNVIPGAFPNLGTLTVSGAPTPEPGTFLMLGSGLLGVASLLRRKVNL